MEIKCLFFSLFVGLACRVSALPTTDNLSGVESSPVRQDENYLFSNQSIEQKSEDHESYTESSTVDQTEYYYDDLTTDLTFDNEESTDRNQDYTKNSINEETEKSEEHESYTEETSTVDQSENYSSTPFMSDDDLITELTLDNEKSTDRNQDYNEMTTENEAKDDNTKDLILEAISNDDENQTKTLIEQLNGNFYGSYDITWLAKAAQQCKPKVAKMLIENGVSVDITDEDNWPIITVASYYACEDVAKILIENGAYINARTGSGYSSLHLAAREGNAQIVKLLIKNGADVTMRDFGYFERTPRVLAEMNGHWDVVNILKEVELNKNNAIDSIMEALLKDDANQTKTLIEQFNGNFNGSDDIIWLGMASEKCKLNVAKMLIENGVSVEVHKKDEWHPLHIAAYNGCDKEAKLLIENGADLNIRNGIGHSSLHMAIKRRNYEIADLLIENGAEIDREDSWYLIYVTPDSTTELATEPATESTTENDLNQKVEENDELNGNPNDMILDAISKDDGNQTETLIEDLIAGYLKVAAEKCKPNVAKKLIQNGINVNVSYGESKWRPLHVATDSDCEEVARLLIENGADINVKTGTGFTALHLAAKNGGAKIAELLIKNGADIELKDSNRFTGWSALDWAHLGDHDAVVKVLTENAAKIQKTDSDSSSEKTIEDYYD